MARPDEAHNLTDAHLAGLEHRIAKLYREARDELQETVTKYFAALKKRDAEQKKRLDAGKITEEEYKRWRLNQIGRGKRFEALRDEMAKRYTDANAVAVAYTNDETPGIYSLNRNYAAYTIEKTGADVSFTMFDEQTVKRLLVEEPDLMPYYPKPMALKRGIDLAYGKRQITASVTSGILQGKSIGKIANDLQGRMETMNRASAIRTARTAVTGAQNAGRQDGYVAAEKMGIQLEREWLATLDARTRHAHAMLDGQRRPVDKPFEVDGYEILFPGDPAAKPYLVYNCRCTLVAAVKGVDTSDAKRRVIDPETGESLLVENMTYQEWAGWKKETDNLLGSGSGRTKNIPADTDHVKSLSIILGVDEKNIRISNLPEESQASIERQVKKVLDYFPQLKGHFTRIVYDDTITAVASSQSIGGTIKVSKNFLDYDALSTSYAKGEKFGFYAKGTSADSVIVHELGHQIDGFLTKKGLFDGEITQYGTIRASQRIQKEILKKIGLSDQRLKEIRQEWRGRGYTGRDLTDAVLWERKEFISNHVSEYATTNEREFFAECFSELLTSEHPREAALALGEILEQAKGML